MASSPANVTYRILAGPANAGNLFYVLFGDVVEFDSVPDGLGDLVIADGASVRVLASQPEGER